MDIASLAIPQDIYRVTDAVQQEKTPKRTFSKFLRGPVDWVWPTAAARLPGRALHVAIALAYLDGSDSND